MISMYNRKNLFHSVIIILLISLYSCTSVYDLSSYPQHLRKNKISHIQIISDTLFNSKQIINILVLPKKAFKKFSITFGFCDYCLKGTSSIAANNNAIAAINGGFFDRDLGGNVRYLEINDSVISRTRQAISKWATPDSLTNGSIVLYGTDSVKIEVAKNDQFYENSKSESAVLVTGPLLIKNSQPQKLPNMSFTNNRHPRTCFCITDESILLITIDGRSENAAGMNLFEIQKFLLNLKCTEAINLDGGGSTTMWIKDKGIINHPSDKEGERQVADALLILKK